MPITGEVARRVAVSLLLAVSAATLSACANESTSGRSGVSEVRKKYPTPMDLSKARAECLNERGWGVKVNERAEIEATYTSNRQAEYENDNTACLLKLGIDPDAPTPAAVVEEAYGIYLDGAKCLTSAGWTISKPPSLQTFKDTYETSPWYPWAEIPEQEAAEALSQCPGPLPTY